LGIFLSILQRTPVLRVQGQNVVTNSLRADALLIYLCLSGEVIHTRESLACLLWEDADPKRSMGSLRQLIRKIRLSAPELEKTIDFGRSSITVDKSDISSDLDFLRDTFDAKGTRETPRNFDFAMYEILLNYVGISGYFDSWIAVLRNHIDFSLRETLNRVLAQQDGLADNRNYAARMLLHFDPANEPACCYLMRAHAKAGNQAVALQVYNTLYQFLEDQYDAEPAEETQALVARIKLGDLPGQVEPSVFPAFDPSGTQPSIYVTKFILDDDDAQIGNFVRVFRQELFVNLSTFREWRVFDAEPSAGGGYRLEGLAGVVGEDIYFIATLKLSPDNRIVWSERFGIDFANWGTVLRDIAKRLSLAVDAGISLDRLNQRLSVNISDQNLFDKWLLAHSYLAEWDSSKHLRASQLLDSVLEHDPDFAPARSSRANVESTRHLNLPGIFRSEKKLALGLTHARHALKVDPLDTRAHLSMGWALAMSGQFDASLLHFETCRDLNPCSALGNLGCALGLSFAGQTKRAGQIADEILALVQNIPPYLWGYVQNIRFLDSDLDQAIKAGERAGSSIVNMPGWQAAALWEAGEVELAGNAAQEFAQVARQLWQSNDKFSHGGLTHWFVSCFPIKAPDQRHRLSAGLSAALLVATEQSANGIKPGQRRA